MPARRAHLPARDPGGPAAFTACSIGFGSKLLLAVCGTTRQERPSDRAHHMRPPTGVLPVISGTAPLLPLLQLLLSSPLLHVRSRVQGCSQGHRSRVCVRQHTPVSGATVDKMHRPQLAAANHCSARWSGCCTLLAERLNSSSSTGAPRAMPLAEHSVSEASLASCWLERPPIGFCLSVCTFEGGRLKSRPYPLILEGFCWSS